MLKMPQPNKRDVIRSMCVADCLDKMLFQTQNWTLLDYYNFYATIMPCKLLEQPQHIISSSMLQKYMNTKKKVKQLNVMF
jgi:hypothetical protein